MFKHINTLHKLACVGGIFSGILGGAGCGFYENDLITYASNKERFIRVVGAGLTGTLIFGVSGYIYTFSLPITVPLSILASVVHS